MATLEDIYGQLFGKSAIQDGDVISMAEHGRVGGLSTGQGFKYVGILNASGSLVSEFGGTGSALATVTAVQGPAGSVPWLVTLATLSVVTQPGAGALATVTSIQGDPGAIPWLMTMGTLSVVTQTGAGALATVTSHQGLAGATPWLVTQATLPVNVGTPPVTQSGTWTVQPVNTPNTTAWLVTMGTLPVAASFSGSIPVAGGSLTAYQGTSPWVISGAVTNANLDVTLGSRLASGSTLPITGNVGQLGAWSVGASISNALTIQSLPTLSVFQGTSPWTISGAVTNTNLDVTLGSRLASGSTLPVTGNIGQLGTWTVQPGNTPNTTAWLVTMGTLPVAASFSGSIPVAGGSLTVYQGTPPWSVLATISNNVNTLNAGGSLSAYNVGGSLSAYAVGGSLTAFQGGSPWSISNAGGSMTAYQGSAPWSMANAGGSLTVYPGNVPNTVAWLVTMATLAVGSPLPAGTNALGKLLPPDIDVTAHTNYAKKYYTNAGAVTDGIVWSPAAGKRWHVVSLFINVSASATVTFEDDKAGGDEAVLKMELAANSGTVIPFPDKYPWASGEDAADLLVTTSAGNVYITAVGYEI